MKRSVFAGCVLVIGLSIPVARAELTATVRTMYAAAVYESIGKLLLLGDYRVSDGLHLQEVKSLNGSWTLSLVIDGKTRMNFSHSLARRNQSIPADQLADHFVRQLERDKRIVRKKRQSH